MKNKYAIYCSGGASRILKFYKINKLVDYPVEFVFFTGESNDVIDQLRKIFHEKLVVFKNIRKNDDKFNKNELSDILLFNLKKFNVTYLYCFGDKILRGEILVDYKNRIYNFHPSLLPNFPGLNSIDKALDAKAEFIGNTLHIIDDGVDTGEIVLQNAIKSTKFSTYEDVLSLQIFLLEDIWNYIEKWDKKI